MRSLANTSELHLSLTVADLPSLQACVDTEDLEMITSMRNTDATTSLCHVFVSKYFLTLVPLFLFMSKYQHTILTSKTGTSSSIKEGNQIALKFCFYTPKIENDILETVCRWKQPVWRGDAAQHGVSGHTLKHNEMRSVFRSQATYVTCKWAAAITKIFETFLWWLLQKNGDIYAITEKKRLETGGQDVYLYWYRLTQKKKI